MLSRKVLKVHCVHNWRGRGRARSSSRSVVKRVPQLIAPGPSGGLPWLEDPFGGEPIHGLLDDSWIVRDGVCRLAKTEQILTAALPSIHRHRRAGVLSMLGWAEWLRGSTWRAMGWNNEAPAADPRYWYVIGPRVLYETGSTPCVATVKDLAHRVS